MNLSRAIDSKLAGQARTFEVFAWIVVVLIAVQFLVLLELLTLIAPVRNAIAYGDTTGLAAVFAPVGRRLIELLPAACYIGGVIALAQMFGRVVDGELLSRRNAAGLTEVGGALAWGAIAKIAIVPWLLLWIDGDYGFGGFDGSLETYLVFVIGALAVLGSILRHANRLQSELDEIV